MPMTVSPRRTVMVRVTDVVPVFGVTLPAGLMTASSEEAYSSVTSFNASTLPGRSRSRKTKAHASVAPAAVQVLEVRNSAGSNTVSLFAASSAKVGVASAGSVRLQSFAVAMRSA